MAIVFNTPFMAKPDAGFRLGDIRSIWDAIVNANAPSSAYGITAAGTTQATAFALTSVLNEIDTAAASSGVNLPNSKGNRGTPYNYCVIFNNGANAVQVYAAQSTSDTINGIAGATGVAQASGTMSIYFSAKPGVWFSIAIDSSSSASQSQFGSGTATFPPEGFVNKQVFGQTANEPATTGSDIVLASFSIPANSFDVANRGITVTAAGGYGATANTKTCKLIFNPASATVGSAVGANGTTVATTGALTQSGTGWKLIAEVFKFGAAASNTQYSQQIAAASGAVEAGVGVPAFPTATENAAIFIAVTGNAATAVSDINLNLFTIDAIN